MTISQMSSNSVYSTGLYGYNNNKNISKSKLNLESLTAASSGSMDNIKISRQGRMMSRISEMPDVSSMTNDEFRDMLTGIQNEMQESGIDTSNMKDPSQLSDVEIEQMKAQMQKMQEKINSMTNSSGMAGMGGISGIPSGGGKSGMSGVSGANSMSGSGDISSLLNTSNDEDDDSSSTNLYSKTSYELRQMLNDGSITQSEYDTEIARRETSKSDDYDAQIARNQKAIDAYNTLMSVLM